MFNEVTIVSLVLVNLSCTSLMIKVCMACTAVHTALESLKPCISGHDFKVKCLN